MSVHVLRFFLFKLNDGLAFWDWLELLAFVLMGDIGFLFDLIKDVFLLWFTFLWLLIIQLVIMFTLGTI